MKVTLEVGIDKENNIQHRLNLIISFGKPLGYLELSFYFNMTNKENTEITSSPTSIYDREITKKLLPKNLIGKNIFMNKLKEMLKILITMEKPDSFFMETYENYTNQKQLDFYNNIVEILLKDGYEIEKQGINHEKKYSWKFIKKGIIKPLKENWDNFDIFNHIKDTEYWKRHDEHAAAIMKSINEQRRRNKNYK